VFFKEDAARMSKDDDFLAIDLLALEEENARQAGLYRYHAEVLADAQRDLEAAKNELSVRKAELLIRISADPSVYGLQKATVDSLAAAVTVQPEVVKLEAQIVQLQHDVAIFKATVEAIRQRGSSLDNETRLFQAGYWSVPWVSNPELKEMVLAEEQRLRRVRARKRCRPGGKPDGNEKKTRRTQEG